MTTLRQANLGQEYEDELSRTREAMREAMLELEVHQVWMTGALVASCNCDTKPPDVELHSEWCRYRQLSERLEQLDNRIAAIRKEFELE